MPDLNPSTTTAIQTQQVVPSWYQSYLEQVMGRATGVANQPYQTYPGQRVAGFTGDQNNAFNTIRGMQGGYRPYLTAAMGEAGEAANSNVLGAAAPFYSRATEGFPSAVSRYMSPYISGVTDEIARLGTENLSENLLPAVNDQFVAAGQYGSGRNQEFVNRAVRDTGREILGAQSNALQAGYGQAGQLYGQDVNAQLAAGQGTAQAINQDVANARSAADLYSNLGEASQGFALRDAAALEGVGQQQQALGQKSLDTAYSDFLRQLNYPQEQTSFLSSIIRGFNPPVSSSQTSTGPANANQLAPSSISQIGGLATGALGLAGLFGGSSLFGKTGGSVPKGLSALRMAEGGSVRDTMDRLGRTPAEDNRLWDHHKRLRDKYQDDIDAYTAETRELQGGRVGDTMDTLGRTPAESNAWFQHHQRRRERWDQEHEQDMRELGEARRKLDGIRKYWDDRNDILDGKRPPRGWGIDRNPQPQRKTNDFERDTWSMASGGLVAAARMAEGGSTTRRKPTFLTPEFADRLRGWLGMDPYWTTEQADIEAMEAPYRPKRRRGWGLQQDENYNPQRRQSVIERDTWEMARGGSVKENPRDDEYVDYRGWGPKPYDNMDIPATGHPSSLTRRPIRKAAGGLVAAARAMPARRRAA